MMLICPFIMGMILASGRLMTERLNTHTHTQTCICPNVRQQTHVLFPAQVKHKQSFSSLTADRPEEEKKSEEAELKEAFVFIGNQRKKQPTCRQQEGRSHREGGGRIQPGCPKDERILDSDRRSGQC